MPAHLILTLDGVLQAWGGHTFETFRPTEFFPTRSGLAGLFAACLGVRRNERQRLQEIACGFTYAARLDNLAGDRTKRCGRLTDFHTVQNVRTVKGQPKETEVTRRQYLEDAVFTVAVRFASDQLMDDAVRALQAPVFTPYLGRKSCLPNQPVYHSRIEAGDLQHALARIPPAAGTVYSEEPGPSVSPMRVRDVPLFGRARAVEPRTIYVYTREAGHAPQ